MSGHISFDPDAPAARTIELLRQQVADLEGIIARDNEGIRELMEALTSAQDTIGQLLQWACDMIETQNTEIARLHHDLETTRAWLPGGMGVPG